jgi:DNA-binding CsgD family transcriptional regulator
LQVSAARLLGRTSALLESVGFQFDPEDRRLLDGYIAATRARLGENAFGRAWAEGRAMSVDEAIAYVRSASTPVYTEVETRNAKRETSAGKLTPSPQASGVEIGGLTRREREVAVLISEGKSNRVIGEELVVSERTVEGHVNNILTKLGFRSRAQISAWAVAKGLVKVSG